MNHQLDKISSEEITREFIGAYNFIPSSEIITVIRQTLKELNHLNQKQSGLSVDLNLYGEVQGPLNINARFQFNSRVKLILDLSEKFHLQPIETTTKIIGK